jgi:uncharacterized membrane protein YjjB (DUF3815 family)
MVLCVVLAEAVGVLWLHLDNWSMIYGYFIGALCIAAFSIYQAHLGK